MDMYRNALDASRMNALQRLRIVPRFPILSTRTSHSVHEYIAIFRGDIRNVSLNRDSGDLLYSRLNGLPNLYHKRLTQLVQIGGVKVEISARATEGILMQWW